mmetsp:Transcript_35338/g.31795  ORF Transcript_35338/g.31795 Transcript_35338/m.31795 type:complete len:117 (+) Transcript_35338:1531-1881(+)
MICNNSLQYVNNSRDFFKSSADLVQTDKDNLMKHYDEHSIKKEFVEIAKKTIRKIGQETLYDIVQQWNGVSILDINVEDAVSALADKKPDLMKKIDTNFKGKIDVAFLEGMCHYYM